MRYDEIYYFIDKKTLLYSAKLSYLITHIRQSLLQQLKSKASKNKKGVIYMHGSTNCKKMVGQVVDYRKIYQYLELA